MSWRDRSFSAPIRYSSATPAAAKELLAAESGEPEPSAVLVFHGMGQQVRFETLSDLASTILDEAEARKGNVTDLHIGLAPKADAPGQFLARAEIAWTDKDNVDHAAHVYEAYWAPLTEGKVSYWDTIEFLLEGGWNGLRCSLLSMKWSFDRWVFGGFKKMAITKGTPLALVLVLLILGFTVGIIAMAGAAVASIAKNLSSPDPLEAIRIVLNTVYCQIAGPWNSISSYVESLYDSTTAGASNRAWQLPIPTAKTYVFWGYYFIGIPVWGALIGLAFFVRYFIVGYVGAVAAYLAPYKDSKFDELRGAIQKVGLDAARLVYYGSKPATGAEKAPAETTNAAWIPDYKNIVLVGHSLGTVLAYDTLNAIFNIENTNNKPGAPNRAVERTRALITFGSPLDKAAFIFRAQFNRDTNIGRIREMMACAVQPMITDYRFRFNPIPAPHGPRWINLWSPLDIISGNLGYFDDPAQAPSMESQVENQIDPACTVPLYAHVQYWKGKLLRRTVYDYLI
jgi:hypothetical protein